jgi:hypothetical protein
VPAGSESPEHVTRIVGGLLSAPVIDPRMEPPSTRCSFTSRAPTGTVTSGPDKSFSDRHAESMPARSAIIPPRTVLRTSKRPS